MQFKSFMTLTSLVALAAAAPNAIRDTASANSNLTLTTHFTTQTFTATRVLQSFMENDPWVTTITTDTVWTVAHTVTVPVTSSPTAK